MSVVLFLIIRAVESLTRSLSTERIRPKPETSTFQCPPRNARFRGFPGVRARARVHTKKCIFRCNFGHPPQLVRKGGPPKSGPPRARAPPGPPGGPPGPPKRAPRGTPPGTPKTDPRGQNIPPSPEPFRFPLSSMRPYEPWSGHDRFARSYSLVCLNIYSFLRFYLMILQIYY